MTGMDICGIMKASQCLLCQIIVSVGLTSKVLLLKELCSLSGL